MKIAILPGDGIGPEIMREAVRVLDLLRQEGETIEYDYAPIGGAGYDAAGHPLPDATLRLAQDADAILFGAIGGAQKQSVAPAARARAGGLRSPPTPGVFRPTRPPLR